MPPRRGRPLGPAVLALLLTLGCANSTDEHGEPLYDLQVLLTGDGSGTVTSGDGQINCPGSCWGEYHDGEEVELTATPASGSTFVGWQSYCPTLPGADPADPTITVVVTAVGGTPTCTAEFSLNAVGPMLTVVDTITFHGHPEHARMISASRAILAAQSPPVGESEGRLAILNLADRANLQYEYDDGFCPDVRKMVHGPLGGGLGDGFYGLSPGSATVCTTTDPPGSTGFSMGISWADGARVTGTGDMIFTAFNPGELVRLNTSTGSLTWSVPLTPGVRSCPFSMALNASGTVAWAVGREGAVGTATENCNNHRGIWKVDAVAGTVSGFASLGPQPREVAVAPAEDFAYVSDFMEGNIRKVDLSTMTVTATWAIGTNPVGVDVSPNGNYLAVADWGADMFRVFELSTGDEIASLISPRRRPSGVVWLDDEFLLGVMFGDPAPPPVGKLGGIGTFKLEF